LRTRSVKGCPRGSSPTFPASRQRWPGLARPRLSSCGTASWSSPQQRRRRTQVAVERRPSRMLQWRSPRVRWADAELAQRTRDPPAVAVTVADADPAVGVDLRFDGQSPPLHSLLTPSVASGVSPTSTRSRPGPPPAVHHDERGEGQQGSNHWPDLHRPSDQRADPVSDRRTNEAQRRNPAQQTGRWGT